jgi:hypothetical protein
MDITNCVVCDVQCPSRHPQVVPDFGSVCEVHKYPAKFSDSSQSSYRAICPLRERCRVPWARRGYKLTSAFYDHIRSHGITPREAYELVITNVRKAHAENRIEPSAERIAPTIDPAVDSPLGDQVTPSDNSVLGEQISSAVDAAVDSPLADQIAPVDNSPVSDQIAPSVDSPLVEQITPAVDIALAELNNSFWNDLDHFSTRHRYFEGALTSAQYLMRLNTELRDGRVANMVDDVFAVREGRDLYTGCDRTLLLALDSAYTDNLEELGGNQAHPAFIQRTAKDDKKRFFEVDHVFDVQLFVRAIITTNKCTENDQFVGTLTFNHIEYLRSIINDPENLNVTTWKINAYAKNKLVTKFLEMWHFRDNGIKPSATTIMATEITPQVRTVLTNPLLVNEGPTTVHQRLCRAMRKTLVEFIGPKLNLPESDDWLPSERLYCKKLLSVLKHMCLSLWPIDEFYPLAVED